MTGLNIKELTDEPLKGPNDEPETYKIPYKSQNFNIVRDTIFPFWRIRMDKGQVPPALSGQFTSRSKAEEVVNHFIANHV